MTRRTSIDHARSAGPARREAAGTIRRLLIDITSKALWRLTGARNAAGRPESFDAEVFAGVGFWSRPPTTGAPEAVVASVASSPDHPIVVALRDEKTRQAVAGALGVDETMLFNSLAVIYAKNDGTVEIRTAGGTAVPLALKSDLDQLRAAFGSAVIALGAGGAADIVVKLDLLTVPNPWPIGTSTLKGE